VLPWPIHPGAGLANDSENRFNEIEGDAEGGTDIAKVDTSTTAVNAAITSANVSRSSTNHGSTSFLLTAA
jgi:hypothetical protein